MPPGAREVVSAYVDLTTAPESLPGLLQQVVVESRASLAEFLEEALSQAQSCRDAQSSRLAELVGDVVSSHASLLTADGLDAVLRLVAAQANDMLGTGAFAVCVERIVSSMLRADESVPLPGESGVPAYLCGGKLLLVYLRSFRGARAPIKYASKAGRSALVRCVRRLYLEACARGPVSSSLVYGLMHWLTEEYDQEKEAETLKEVFDLLSLLRVHAFRQLITDTYRAKYVDSFAAERLQAPPGDEETFQHPSDSPCAPGGEGDAPGRHSDRRRFRFSLARRGSRDAGMRPEGAETERAGRRPHSRAGSGATSSAVGFAGSAGSVSIASAYIDDPSQGKPSRSAASAVQADQAAQVDPTAQASQAAWRPQAKDSPDPAVEALKAYEDQSAEVLAFLWEYMPISFTPPPGSRVTARDLQDSLLQAFLIPTGASRLFNAFNMRFRELEREQDCAFMFSWLRTMLLADTAIREISRSVSVSFTKASTLEDMMRSDFPLLMQEIAESLLQACYSAADLTHIFSAQRAELFAPLEAGQGGDALLREWDGGEMAVAPLACPDGASAALCCIEELDDLFSSFHIEKVLSRYVGAGFSPAGFSEELFFNVSNELVFDQRPLAMEPARWCLHMLCESPSEGVSRSVVSYTESNILRQISHGSPEDMRIRQGTLGMAVTYTETEDGAASSIHNVLPVLFAELQASESTPGVTVLISTIAHVLRHVRYFPAAQEAFWEACDGGALDYRQAVATLAVKARKYGLEALSNLVFLLGFLAVDEDIALEIYHSHKPSGKGVSSSLPHGSSHSAGHAVAGTLGRSETQAEAEFRVSRAEFAFSVSVTPPTQDDLYAEMCRCLDVVSRPQCLAERHRARLLGREGEIARSVRGPKEFITTVGLMRSYLRGEGDPCQTFAAIRADDRMLRAGYTVAEALLPQEELRELYSSLLFGEELGAAQCAGLHAICSLSSALHRQLMSAWVHYCEAGPQAQIRSLLRDPSAAGFQRLVSLSASFSFYPLIAVDPGMEFLFRALDAGVDGASAAIVRSLRSTKRLALPQEGAGLQSRTCVSRNCRPFLARRGSHSGSRSPSPEHEAGGRPGWFEAPAGVVGGMSVDALLESAMRRLLASGGSGGSPGRQADIPAALAILPLHSDGAAAQAVGTVIAALRSAPAPDAQTVARFKESLRVAGAIEERCGATEFTELIRALGEYNIEIAAFCALSLSRREGMLSQEQLRRLLGECEEAGRLLARQVGLGMCPDLGGVASEAVEILRAWLVKNGREEQAGPVAEVPLCEEGERALSGVLELLWALARREVALEERDAALEADKVPEPRLAEHAAVAALAPLARSLLQRMLDADSRFARDLARRARLAWMEVR